jgi:beta-galactosidase
MPITGCAYYPEHWNPDGWEEDARLMCEMGLSVVRIAEFAWDKMEPEEGEYDFAWLDRAVETLAAAGLQLVMCTPTPTPPPWLTYQHPDICRVGRDGIRISPGARRHACSNVPSYWSASEKIVEAITSRYGKHPSVIGWQVDNEFGCGETARCYCDHCRAAFHHWLEEKYGTLDTLNAAWGTQFWGMTYRDWKHIPIPGITTEPQSPAMQLDYRRFSSDSWVRFQRMQIGILRRNAPGRWITHNFMIRHWSLDYWKLAQDIDLVSYDNYPTGLRDDAEVCMNFDLMRSFKQKPFWVIEQQAGRVNWHAYNPSPPEGQVKLWSHQAVAHGAEGIVYFRFRAARFGQEQFHSALMKWDKTPAQGFYEAQQVSHVFSQLPSLTRPKAKVGIIFDYEDLWAIEIEPHNKEFLYWDLVYEIYKVFWDANIPIDFLPRNCDPGGYELIILPAGYLVHPGEAEKWRPWVEAGNRLVITFRTGMREPGNIAVDLPIPAGMTDLIGAKVSYAYSVPPESYTAWGEHRTGSSISGSLGYLNIREKYKIWAETLEPTTAEILCTYDDGMLKGKTAATINRVGAGEVIYLGCWLNDFRYIRPGLAQLALKEIILDGDDGSQWQLTYNPSARSIGDMKKGEGFAVHYERLADGYDIS